MAIIHDGNGNRVLVQDGLGTTTRQDYDPLNRLKTTIQNYEGLDPATHDATTQFAYDTRDNLRSVVDPDGLTTNYTYDGLNNLTQLSSPDTGVTNYTPDAAGNRVAQTDARGVTTTYTYDALNRLTATAYPTASLDVTYAYDQPNATTGCSGSYPLGRLTTMTDASGSTSYCYDRRGNVLRKKQTTGTLARTTQYTYTLADRLSSITYPSGAKVTYGRDALGRVTSLGWAPNRFAPPTPLVTGTSYAPFGPLTGLTFGNGRTLSKAYDQDYAIDSISSSAAGGLTLDFGVDVSGNITSASATLNPPTPDRVYGYDPLYRLTSAATGSASPLEGYTYSKTGDRLSASLNGGTATPYAYTPATHHLASVGATGRTYDANGNTQTGVGGWTFSYDDTNRLASASKGLTGYTCRFNGRGERVRKTRFGTGTSDTVYGYDEAGHLLGEYKSSGATQAEYLYLDDTLVAVNFNGTLDYVETDQLGTPRQLIEPARNVAVWTWDSLGGTFGTNTPNTDPDGDGNKITFNPRFPGQYFDAESGLNYNGARDFESGTGRYIESDPIGLMGGLSTFAYVGSHPTRSYDPQGLFDPTPWPAPAPPPTGVWPRVFQICADANPIVMVIVGSMLPNSTGDCDQPYPPPQNNCPADDNDDECKRQEKSDERMCRMATIPGTGPRARCWESVKARYYACKNNLPIPRLVIW